MASGRIVVIAVGYGLLGAMALLVGVGPQLEGANLETRLVGWLAIALGATQLVGAITLGLRLRHARSLGKAGALATILMGTIVMLAALENFGACSVGRTDVWPCQALVGGFAVLGAAISLLGTAAAVVLRRTRPDAFRRSPRSRRPRDQR